MKLAILLTCFNRKIKTLSCLKVIYEQASVFDFDIYLLDDGSTDGTSIEVAIKFPLVKLIKEKGNLYWAGGMRKCWQAALDSNIGYDYFLLLNDDTVLAKDAFENILLDIKQIKDNLYILVGSTTDFGKTEISYGGRLLNNGYGIGNKIVVPNNTSPQICHLGHANIMLIPYNVYKKIGMLSATYTHGIADFDYTLRAKKAGIPSYVASKFLGNCQHDHGNNWKSSDKNLKQRIAYLYDIKGLAYKEYIKFIYLYFPYSLPKAWFLLWGKTFFPSIWDRFKKV